MPFSDAISNGRTGETGFDRVRERSRSSIEGRLLRGTPMVIDARNALPSEVDTGRQPLAV